MLRADIDQLNRLSSMLDGVGDEVDGIDVRTEADSLADLLPGCALVPACGQAGEFVEGAYLRVAGRMRQVASITRECSRNLETTDAEFADRMREFDVVAVGRR
ncbi:hypothetical protein [Nocardia sp. CNY236]|uniref:hypothetical protein n=1 Tax=Nocardia sp. CNY236 TaxID=1169152 RepID=UPI0003FB2EDE|nr:hypothetical protein [Nocardia sp. CNY236]